MGLSTHVLDLSTGRPAAGVPVRLTRWTGSTWIERGSGTTDGDGRVRSLLSEGVPLEAGLWQLRFEVGSYQASRGVTGFYPWVEIAFTVSDPVQHHHVPLLLSPWGFSTYRGS